MEAIRLEKVRKRYGKGVLALDKVSLLIEEGELFFLLGSSGCGKTTILRSIAGLERPDSGRIYFGERNITDVHINVRQQ